MSEQEDIKSCPHCGGRAIALSHSKIVENHWVSFVDCFAMSAPWDTEKNAIKHWNQRIKKTKKEV